MLGMMSGLFNGSTHTHTQPFYSSLDFVRDNPGELEPEGTFHHLPDFLVQNEDNIGRYTNNLDSGWTATPSRLIGAPISAIPTILCRMPFLAQPSQFTLAWDKHQICCLA